NYLPTQSGTNYPVRSTGSDVLLYSCGFKAVIPNVTAYEAAYYSTGYVSNTSFCSNTIDIDARSGQPNYNSYVNALTGNTFSGYPSVTCKGNVAYPSSGYQMCGMSKPSIEDVGLGKSSTEEPPLNPDIRNNPEYKDFIEAMDLYHAIRIELSEAEESGNNVSTESYISDYETIIEKLKTFISNHPDDELAGTAMRLIGTIYLKLNRPEEIANYTNIVLNDSKLKKVEWHAKKLLLTYHIQQNNTQFALVLADELIEGTDKEDLKCLALYEKGLIYAYSAKDMKKAVDCFEKIIKKYPDSPIAQLAAAQLELLNMEGGFEKSSPSPLSEDGDLAMTNYPNPSNPETTIHFRLPEKDRVTLKIFDIRGREVQTLLDREMDSGEQRIIWDGKDSMGNVAASGIYFYQIQFRDKVLTKKMTLIR
ncbi:T9SS type A sorting domain-containing protein, partial [bacterium]|nr:T9SS type A sorting domain-containing protein [bacterium]